MLLSQLARNMPSVQRKTLRPQFCYFFHNICPHPADDKSPALTYTAHAAPASGRPAPNTTILSYKESSHERDQSCRA